MMKAIRCLALALVIGLTGLSGLAAAKCYRFHYTPPDYWFCHGRGGADAFRNREEARKICLSVLSGWSANKKCGRVWITFSSCHSNSGHCYDESGQAHRDLKGY